MKYFTSVLILLIFSKTTFSQSINKEDKNAVIIKCSREFRFVAGNAEHPVQIKETSRREYTCKNYRADIPVAEFYDDMETIDDVTIKVDGDGYKKHGISPKHDYYQSEGIFYSDAKVCYFSLPVVKQGSVSEVTIEKTNLDPRYLCNIFFMEGLPIESQEIKIIVPSWMELEIKEYNFSSYDVTKKVSESGNEKTYTFGAANVPSISREEDAPGLTYYSPHILLLSKSAQPKGTSYTYFKTTKEQYDWYRGLVKQVGDDESFIKSKTETIITGAKTDEEKVKKIFQWVQDNIRYIAFENGLAGFRPAKSQDVLQKKYGDCKGMANLLTVMLRSINLDARRCWIGTKQIAYDYSTPSLAVDNHMICAWMRNGKPVFLDATEKYIGYGEVAERIQGRQTLIENGDNYLLERVPVSPHHQNTSTEYRKFSIDGNNLKGKVTQTWKGESKEWLLTQLHNIKQDKQENALKQFLADGKTNFEISNMKIENLTDYNADLKVEYDVNWKNVLSSFDKESYLEINNRRDFSSLTIDTAVRKQSYLMPFKSNLVFETEIVLPPNTVVSTLPESLQIKESGYHFTSSYTANQGKLVYRNEIVLNNTEIKPADFPRWNNDINKLKAAYNQQIVFTQK